VVVRDAFKAIKIKLALELNVEIEEPERGEAESIIYKTRNTDYPSVLYSKDTDLYAIAYRHKRCKENDRVFICNDTLKSLHDMEVFSCTLNKRAFRLLMVLRGTDYDEVFTNSMVQAVFYCMHNLNVYSEDDRECILGLFKQINEATDICLCIGLFVELILVAKRSTKVNVIWPRWNSQYTTTEEDVFLICQMLQWTVEYYEHGADYEHYNRTFPSLAIRKHSFISRVLAIHFGLEGDLSRTKINDVIKLHSSRN